MLLPIARKPEGISFKKTLFFSSKSHNSPLPHSLRKELAPASAVSLSLTLGIWSFKSGLLPVCQQPNQMPDRKRNHHSRQEQPTGRHQLEHASAGLLLTWVVRGILKGQQGSQQFIG